MLVSLVACFFVLYFVSANEPCQEAKSPFKVVCYFKSWSVYRIPTYKIENIPAERCTHIIYASAHIDEKFQVIHLDRKLDIGKFHFSRFNNQPIVSLSDQEGFSNF